MKRSDKLCCWVGWEITKEISFFSILSTHLLQIKVLLGQGKIFWLHRRYLEGHEGPPHYQHRHRPDRSLHFVSLPVQPVSFCHLPETFVCCLSGSNGHPAYVAFVNPLSKHDQKKQEKTQRAKFWRSVCLCTEVCACHCVSFGPNNQKWIAGLQSLKLKQTTDQYTLVINRLWGNVALVSATETFWCYHRQKCPFNIQLI